MNKAFVAALLAQGRWVCLAQDAQFNPYTMSAGTYSAAMFNHQAREILERDHKILRASGDAMAEALRRVR
jgi:hypothetical protein